MFRLIFDSHYVFYYTIDDISRGYKSISLTPSSLQLRLNPLSTDSAQCHIQIFERLTVGIGFSGTAFKNDSIEKRKGIEFKNCAAPTCCMKPECSLNLHQLCLTLGVHFIGSVWEEC